MLHDEALLPKGYTMLLKLLVTYFGPMVTHLRRRLRLRANQRQGLQLRAMSDLELRDLGLGRSEIPALINRTVSQDTIGIWGNRHPT